MKCSDKGERKETIKIHHCYKPSHILLVSGPEVLNEKSSRPQDLAALHLVYKSTEHITVLAGFSSGTTVRV